MCIRDRLEQRPQRRRELLLEQPSGGGNPAGSGLAGDLDAFGAQGLGEKLGRVLRRVFHAIAVVETLVAGEGGQRPALELQARLPGRAAALLVEPALVAQHAALYLADLEHAKALRERLE